MRIHIYSIFLSALLVFFFAAQFCNADTPAFFLSFDGTLIGASGQTPIDASDVTFEEGKMGQGAYFGSGSILRYNSSSNIDSQEGTLEFWFKPSWSGVESANHTFVSWGDAGGVLFAIDGAANLRGIFNRYSQGGKPEVQAIKWVGDWTSGIWRHVAFTWSSSGKVLRLYIDGTLANEYQLSDALPVIDSSLFDIGSENGQEYANGVIDGLTIFTRAKSAAEIAQSYLASVGITGLSFEPNSLTLWETWWHTPTLLAQTPAGITTVPNELATWETSNPAVASFMPDTRILATGGGVCDISASLNEFTATLNLTVNTAVSTPEEEPLDPVLATPMEGYLWEMPVVSIRIIPTTDGFNVDSSRTGETISIADLKERISAFEKRVKYGLEERSRFRGYKDSSARPSLGYRVVKIITIHEPIPPYMEFNDGSGWFQPDYNQILTRIGAEHLVNDLGVKEFWVWGYHYDGIYPVESNMSSPLTGDISNSYRLNDLPIFDRTYTLYGYNYTRTQSEALHNHGHQIEAIMDYVSSAQDGNSDLFWKKFTGRQDDGQQGVGRAGNCHCPPNTNIDYDYSNSTLVLSDCEDWTPDNLGQKTLVNSDTWSNLSYAWPGDADFWQRAEAQYYLYWWQNMPGWDNTISNGADFMTNWWRFTGDWDTSVSSISSEGGLHGPRQAALTILDMSPAQGSPNQQVPLMAILSKRSDGSAVSGKTLTFKVAGITAGTATTNTSGVATVIYTIPSEMAGNQEMAVEFSGDTDFAASTGSGILVTPISYNLYVIIKGTGGGSVHSNPAGFSCSKNRCVKAYGEGTTLTLSTTPDANSLFTSWSGDCSGGSCSLTMNAEHTIEATFNYVSPAMIKETSQTFSSLQAAYNAAITGQTILARNFTFVEPLTLNQEKIVTIKGGYAPDYVARPGYTLLQGILVIQKGRLSSDGLIVR